MGIGFKGIVESIICTEFEKNVGRWQSKENEPKAMLVTFRLDVNYKIEEGYRHLDLMLYGPQNYVGVFARERWVVIPREDLECDEYFDTMVKKDAQYQKGQTPWMMEGYHDTCWRDAVDRVIWANQDRINSIGGKFSDWYSKIQVTEEFIKKLGPLMCREGDYRYKAGKGVLFFNNDEVTNENKNQ